MELNKSMNNVAIAELLRSVAAAYQLKADRNLPAGKVGNKFKIIAYQRAADAVEHASSELKDLWDDGKLDDIPGIGASIAGHLDDLFRTGKVKHFDEVMEGLPPAMFDLMEIPGIGAKRAYRLTQDLRLKTITDLERAIKQGKVAKLEGFGEDSQEEILKSIEDTKKKSKEKRLILPYAEGIAGEIIEWMKKDGEVLDINPLGSLRRQASTVGDIDIAVSTANPAKVLDHFTKYPNKSRVLERGTRTASIILPQGVQVDLMVEHPAGFGALLQHFTGSKHHNIALRNIALKKGWNLSDYGAKKLKTKNSKLKTFSTENDLYKFFDMDYIPPELREDRGEIEIAMNHKLPDLVELSDIKADLQIHSSYDIETSHDLGESSMEEVVDKANKLGYEYVAFTEHNPSKSKHSSKQIIDILKAKREAVDKINYSLNKSSRKGSKESTVRKIFNSLEIDILSDGSLPVPDEGLATLDFALVSIHSSFRQGRDEMTNRILKALGHPKTKIFAHPTARLLTKREGIEIDWPKIFDFCLKNDKWLEINAEPMRLDLPDVLVRDGVALGVKFSMGTDSHHKDSMENMRWGVSVARRGWAEAKDIVNTRSLAEFEKLLSR